MAELKTKESLLTALKQASERPLSADELRKQRVSFIMGSLKESSTVTRSQVEAELARMEGRRRG